MTNLTLSVSEELSQKMKRFPKVKWSVVAREAIEKELERLEILDRLLSKSKLTEKDAERIGHRIKHEISRNNDSMKIDIDKVKKEAVPILKANHVNRAAIFGSVARGEATLTSDVDFLIEFKKERPTLFDMGGLKGDLEERLKRSVDLVLFRSIDSRLRDRVLKERVDIL